MWDKVKSRQRMSGGDTIHYQKYYVFTHNMVGLPSITTDSTQNFNPLMPTSVLTICHLSLESVSLMDRYSI